MTKEEFKGFSSAAQHDMVLEALVRVTKNLETLEKESCKPFVGTDKQRRNDIKLLTILAEAFGKNELVWAQKSKATRDEVLERGAEESKDNTKPVIGVIGGRKRKTLEEYIEEYIKENKESRGKCYGK